MITNVKEFMGEKAQALAEQARKLGARPIKTARGAATRSAERVKSLKRPIHVVARSGVRLTTVSQTLLQSLIELQEQIVTSALDDAAAQLENAARTESAMELARDQANVLRSTRTRIVEDMTRAVGILKEAGRDVRDVATDAYTKVARPAQAARPAAKAARPAAKAKRARKAKRAVRKTAGRARKGRG
jgi:phasin family protein